MKTLKIIRVIAWGAVAVVGGLFIGLTLFLDQPASRSAVVFDRSAIGGPFRLTAHTGEVVDNMTFAGKPYVVFFGFTHCPDVCPTTLFELSQLMKELGPTANRFRALFITVDPDRDTQELLGEYMTSFDERILALRGSEAETEAVLKSFAAYARKAPTAGGGYTMDHTAGVYLMDGTGNFAGMLDLHEPQESKLAKLRRLAF